MADALSGGREAVFIDDIAGALRRMMVPIPTLGEMVTVTASDGSLPKIARKAD